MNFPHIDDEPNFRSSEQVDEFPERARRVAKW